MLISPSFWICLKEFESKLKITLSKLLAVSYTHLDVYKRQGENNKDLFELDYWKF